MKFKRVHSAFLATVLTCSLVATPVFAEPDDQEKLENQKETAQNELSSLQTQLNTLIQKANELEIKLIDKGEEITQAEKDLEAAEAKKEEQYEAMKLRIKYMYEAGSGTATMEKVMASGDISSILTQAEYTQQVHEYDRNQLDEYVNTITEIENLQTQLEADLENLQSLETEYRAQQDELNSTISSKQDEISNLDEMIQEAARKAQEEAERKAAEEAARQAAQQSSNNTITNNTNNNDTGSNGGNTGGGTADTGGSGGSSSGSDNSYDSVTGNAIVDRAYSKLGCAYVWGACGPDTFDCSGLVSYCVSGSYTRLGTTYTFMGWTRVSDPQPGDICTSSSHCGIYIGNGQMIHAPEPGDVVKIGPVQSGMIYVRP